MERRGEEREKTASGGICASRSEVDQNKCPIELEEIERYEEGEDDLKGHEIKQSQWQKA